jgi:HEAT repeat protein
MSRPRRRMFGPLFYITVTVAVLLAGYVQLESLGTALAAWLRERSLMQTLHADDSRVREAAIVTLMRNGSSKIVPLLVEAARDPRSEQRALACRYLVTAGTRPEEAVPILVAASSDTDPIVRFEVASSFGHLVRGNVFGMAQLASPSSGTPAVDLRAASIVALRRLLKDPVGTTRVAAAEGLGHFGPDAGAAADLEAATGDKERDVRLAAARALLRVNGSSDPSAGRTLVALVADPEPIADRRAVLDVVLSASTEVQDKAAVALAGLLTADEISTSADVMECLVTMGPRARAALPAIERQLDDDDPVQRAGAAVALASIGGKSPARVIDHLLKIVADLSAPVEWRQAALGKIWDVDETKVVLATPILIRQLASKTVDVRENAVEMLRGIVSEWPAALPDPAGAK